MPSGNFNEFPIPFNITDDPTSKVDKTQTVNGHALTGNITLDVSDISGAVPTSRTVNGKALSSNITITAADIDGIKGTIASTDDLNDYRTAAQAGVYYCSNVTRNSPSPYGMLTVYSAGTTLAYQFFVSSTAQMYARYYSSSGSWTNWYRAMMSNIDFGVDNLTRFATGDWGSSYKLGGVNNFWDASGVHGIKGILTSGDLDTFYGGDYSGIWYLGANASAFTNTPVGWAMLIIGTVSSGWCSQLIVKYSGLYYRERSGSPADWTPWLRVEGFNEEDFSYTCPKVYSMTVNANSSKTIKFVSATSGNIVTTSPYSTLRGDYVFYAEGTGQVRTTPSLDAEGLTLTSSTNGLTIANSTAQNANVKFVIYSGSVTSVT